MYRKNLASQAAHHTWVYILIFVGLIILSSTILAAVSTQTTIRNTTDWSSGFHGHMTISNTGTTKISGWSLSFDTDFEIQHTSQKRVGLQANVGNDSIRLNLVSNDVPQTVDKGAGPR